MGLIDEISSSTIYSLDTNIFIYAYGKIGRQGSQSQDLLQKLSQIKPKIYISVIVIEEFLIQIYKQKLDKQLTFYENFLTMQGLINVVDINRSIARQAAQIRAQYPSIRTPDALHLACALESQAEVFLTFEKRLPKKIGNLRVKVLGI